MSSPQLVPKTFGIFRTALNKQWQVVGRSINQYSKSEKTLADQAQLLASLGGVAIAALGVAVWKNKWRWSKDSAIKEVQESMGIYSFDEKRDLRTAEEELNKVLIDMGKNIGQLSLLGKFMVKAGEIAAEQIFGYGYNWNRNVFDNPAYELVQESGALIVNWSELLKDTTTYLKSKSALEEIALNTDDRILAEKFHEQAWEDARSSFVDAAKTTLSVGVRLAQIPAVAPYQEWIKPAMRGTRIKIIRELTPNDLKNPNEFAESVAMLYELRKRMKAMDRAPTAAEKQQISAMDTLVKKLNQKAEEIKNISDPRQRQLEFRLLKIELDSIMKYDLQL
jgi:hypothetical protein